MNRRDSPPCVPIPSLRCRVLTASVSRSGITASLKSRRLKRSRTLWRGGFTQWAKERPATLRVGFLACPTHRVAPPEGLPSAPPTIFLRAKGGSQRGRSSPWPFALRGSAPLASSYLRISPALEDWLLSYSYLRISPALEDWFLSPTLICGFPPPLREGAGGGWAPVAGGHQGGDRYGVTCSGRAPETNPPAKGHPPLGPLLQTRGRPACGIAAGRNPCEGVHSPLGPLLQTRGRPACGNAAGRNPCEGVHPPLGPLLQRRGRPACGIATGRNPCEGGHPPLGPLLQRRGRPACGIAAGRNPCEGVHPPLGPLLRRRGRPACGIAAGRNPCEGGHPPLGPFLQRWGG